MNIKRNVLLNPGPATTTDTVKMAQVVPDICPRERTFCNLIERVNEDLVKIVHGDPETYTAVLFCGSGTINMDVCLNSLLPDNKKILIINNGAYSSRAVEICQYYALPYIELKFPINRLPDLSLIEATLYRNPDVALVYATHNETGTGLLNPIRDIGKLAHQFNCCYVVDTTSTYAMIPIDIQYEGIDFCMASSQKGLMAMTGLSFVIGKKELIEASGNYSKRSYYCNLYLQYKYFKDYHQMHFTPPVQTIYSVVQSLKEYFDEGEENKWLRHKAVFETLHEGLAQLGFKDAIKREWQSGLVISVKYPDDENWNFDSIHDYCYDRGFTIYPGKIDSLNTFRLCALGAITVDDIYEFFKVFKRSLIDNNIKLPVTYNLEGEQFSEQ